MPTATQGLQDFKFRCGALRSDLLDVKENDLLNAIMELEDAVDWGKFLYSRRIYESPTFPVWIKEHLQLHELHAFLSTLKTANILETSTNGQKTSATIYRLSVDPLPSMEIPRMTLSMTQYSSGRRVYHGCKLTAIGMRNFVDLLEILPRSGPTWALDNELWPNIQRTLLVIDKVDDIKDFGCSFVFEE